MSSFILNVFAIGTNSYLALGGRAKRAENGGMA